MDMHKTYDGIDIFIFLSKIQHHPMCAKVHPNCLETALGYPGSRFGSLKITNFNCLLGGGQTKKQISPTGRSEKYLVLFDQGTKLHQDRYFHRIWMKKGDKKGDCDKITH